MNTPTPETDAEVLRCEDKYYRLYPDSKNKPVDDDFARKLERERDEAKDRLEDTALELLGIKAERDQLRKVCDELAYCLKIPTIFQRRESIDAVKAYNQLPHVKDKTK